MNLRIHMRIAMRAIPDLAEQDRASHHPAHVANPHYRIAVGELERLHVERDGHGVEHHLHRLHPQVCTEQGSRPEGWPTGEAHGWSADGRRDEHTTVAAEAAEAAAEEGGGGGRGGREE